MFYMQSVDIIYEAVYTRVDLVSLNFIKRVGDTLHTYKKHGLLFNLLLVLGLAFVVDSIPTFGKIALSEFPIYSSNLLGKLPFRRIFLWNIFDWTMHCTNWVVGNA